MNLIVVPFGTPKWGVQSDNMKNVLQSCKGKKTDIVYLLPQWGLISSKSYSPVLLKGLYDIPTQKLLKQTAVNVRSWLHSKGRKYKRIVVINYGNSMKFWNKGAAGTPMMNKVKLVRYLPNSEVVLRRRITRACNE
tara:strand:- start:174 stop:581 length:408 start_codon:yes stop_codon:yes gene_type:complete